MTVTPFIRPIQLQGGTFYSFSSASEDLGFTFNNDGKQIKFSNYVLLNIPKISRPLNGPGNYENYIQLDAIPGAFEYVTNGKTQNMMFAESFQNYVLNLETVLTAYPSYDPNKLQTISERVFFKWLKEIGALRFRNATSSETSSSTQLFTEENSSSIYNRVIQYIGEIDVVNSVKSSADSFSEIYVHIPTSVGATPLVLFGSIDDINYSPGINAINIPSDPLNTDYIYGRTYLQTNPSGLDTFAYFDSTLQTYGATAGTLLGSLPTITVPGEYQLLKYDFTSQHHITGWWFEYPEAASYWTQPADPITGSFNTVQNDSLMIKGIKSDNSLLELYLQRSRLDGISIDFNKSDYYPIASNPAINSFTDFNSLNETTSFNFNAVLIYYTVTNTTTNESANNLFGILFLNDVEESSSSGGYIPTFTKYKPNSISGMNGNSFGLNINLKFDINTEDSVTITSVNEYAPFSMQLFVNALNELGSAADTLTSEAVEIAKLTAELDNVKSLIYSTADLQNINTRLTTIEQQLVNSQAALANSSTIMSLIQRNYNEILNIYNNLTSVTVAYNMDGIAQGQGITIDKSTPNVVTINNSEQEYTMDVSPLYNVLTDFQSTPIAYVNFIKLSRFSNYIKLSNGSSYIFSKHINIYVDDSQIKWSAGQSFKISVDYNFPIDMYSLGSYNLSVYTDALDTSNSGQPYSQQIALISSNNFYDYKGVPMIEIICIDPTTFTFTVDLI